MPVYGFSRHLKRLLQSKINPCKLFIYPNPYRSDQHTDPLSFSGLPDNLLSLDFLKDLERLANLNGGTVADPLSRDFRKKHLRRFTEKESPELPLSKIYEMYGCGYLNKKNPKK